jgi:hypothetical protein
MRAPNPLVGLFLGVVLAQLAGAQRELLDRAEIERVRTAWPSVIKRTQGLTEARELGLRPERPALAPTAQDPRLREALGLSANYEGELRRMRRAIDTSARTDSTSADALEIVRAARDAHRVGVQLEQKLAQLDAPAVEALSDEARELYHLVMERPGVVRDAWKREQEAVAATSAKQIPEVEIHFVSSVIDGWGLDQTAVQVHYQAVGVDSGSGETIVTPLSPPSTGMAVRFFREGCEVEPNPLALDAGGAREVLAWANGFATSGGVAAMVDGIPRSRTKTLEFRMPWRSFLLLGLGLVLGVLLRPHLGMKIDPNQERPRLSTAIDFASGVVLLSIYIAGVDQLLGGQLPALQLRQGWAIKLVIGALGGVIGLPYLSAVMKRLVRGIESGSAGS